MSVTNQATKKLTRWPVCSVSRLLSRLVLLPRKRAATQQTEHDDDQGNLSAWRQGTICRIARRRLMAPASWETFDFFRA